MPLSAVSLENRTNRLLALLPAADAERISGDLISTYLPHLREVYRSGEPVRAVYFPTDCVVSLLAGLGEQGEGGRVGERSGLCQAPGGAVRIGNKRGEG